jgi:hypothetical protein
MTNANPSIDPADKKTLVGAFKFVFSKLLQDVDGCLPATVLNFDRASGYATVRPNVMIVSTTGEQIQRAPVASVPVFQFGGGGYMLSFNLRPGDNGWIIANDRDISNYIQSNNEARPNTTRKKSFSDGWFLPDVMRGFTINAEDLENAVFQTADGTVRIALWPNKIKMTSPDLEIVNEIKTKITAPETEIISPTINITATTGVNITTPHFSR